MMVLQWISTLIHPFFSAKHFIHSGILSNAPQALKNHGVNRNAVASENLSFCMQETSEHHIQTTWCLTIPTYSL